MHLLSDTILRAVCWTLLHSLWQGLIFAVVAGLVLVLTRKASAALRYSLLCCGMVLFLGVSGYTFYRQLGSDGDGKAIVAGVGGGAKDLVGMAGVEGQDRVTGKGMTPSGMGPVASGLAATGRALRTGIDSLVRYFNTHAALVVLVWFVVLVGRTVQLLSGWVYTQRIRHYQVRPADAVWRERLTLLIEQLGMRRPVSLLESALVRSPVVVGALKPMILVPLGMLAFLSAEQVESILLHELAHIRRRDYLFNLVQHVVDTLFFFNPALIWVSSLIRAERENCCDDVAIRQTNSRRRLIEALVSFHQYEQSVRGYGLAFAAKENQVVRRVRRIVERTNHTLHAGERALLIGGMMVLCGAFVTIRGGREAEKDALRGTVKSASIGVDKKADGKIEKIEKKSVEKNERKEIGKITGKVVEKSERKKVEQITAVEMSERNGGDTTEPSTPGDDLFRNLSADQLIECHDHGVTPAFINEFRAMGYSAAEINIDMAIRLKDHGVSPRFIMGFENAGFGHISLERALMLRDHGVSVDFIQGLKQMGFPDIPLEKAIRLRDHGVTVDFITSWKNKLGKLLTLEDYIKLRDAGISPSS